MIDAEAAARGAAAGLTVVMDRCPAIEYRRARDLTERGGRAAHRPSPQRSRALPAVQAGVATFGSVAAAALTRP